jgi:hypothetical protein
MCSLNLKSIVIEVPAPDGSILNSRNSQIRSRSAAP